MISTLSEEAAVLSTTVVPQTDFLTLAGDAICLAMTALRIKSQPAPTIPASSECSAAQTNIISLDQVSWHDNNDDCWIVIYDRVYDVTNFLQEHPGGAEILLEYAGRDATLAFRGIGHGISMVKGLEPYFVGVLPEPERLFSSNLTGLKIGDVI